MDLFRKPRQLKTAGRKINEDPNTWQAEVARSIANDHPYVSLEGSKIKFNNQDTEQQRAHGAVVFKNGSGAMFFIRPEPLRGKPELDPIDILFHQGRLRHLNEQSYSEAMSADPNLLDKDKAKNYGQPSSGNAYVGKDTGDQSPMSTYGNPAQMLGGPGLQSVRTASCLTGKIITNEDMLARLDRTLLQFTGLAQTAEIFGLKDAIYASGEQAMRDTRGGPSGAMLSRIGLKFFITYPNGDRKYVTIDDLKAQLGPNFKPIMERVMSHGRVPIQTNVQLESVDAKGLRGVMPKITSNGTHHVRIDGDVTVPMRVYTKIIGFDGGVGSKLLAYHPSGMWLTADELDGLKTTEDELYSNLDSEGPYRYKDKTSKGRMYRGDSYMSSIDNAGSQGVESTLRVNEGGSGGGLGGYWGTSLEPNAPAGLHSHMCNEHIKQYAERNLMPPVKPGIGAHFILQFPELDMVTMPFVLTSVREMPNSKYPLFICKDISGKVFGYRLYDSIGRPMRAPLDETRGWGVNGPVYMVPANSSPIPVASNPIEVVKYSVLPPDVQEVKLARIGPGYWSIDGHTVRNHDQFVAMVADLGFKSEVIQKCASLKPDEEYSVYVKNAEIIADATGVRAVVKSANSAMAGKLRKIAGNSKVASLLESFKRAAGEVAQGGDQVAKDAPEAFDAKTIDGLLMMQFADQDTMIEIVQAAPLFEDVENKVAQMLMAARTGKEMLDEEGLTRALRGMGDANKALSMLRLELEVEGVL